ncbi:MAG TPA: tetratricopeptide repeat protein [Steroidobacteraceae bacterium]|nr:tetratricopeptide repeat protein [Steroidobacteraceae bacterium]
MNARHAGLAALLPLLAPAAVLAADAGSAAPTLKDLPKRNIEIHRDQPPPDASAARAMDNYRQLLELKDADPALQAEALRRLGDLSLEGGEQERQDAEVSRVDPGGAAAIDLYTRLLREHPDYARNDRVLYQLARAYETTGQPDKALASLDEIVRRYPQSSAIVEVQFRRGELLFSAHRYREAEAAYAEVTRPGGGEFYQQGLYKQGWSLFKQNLDEDSLPLFARLLDVQLRDPRAPRGVRALDALGRADRELVEDTLRVMSLTFSAEQGIAPLNDFVTRQGNPPYAQLLYSRLGDLYVEKQRYQDAADTYRAFVARAPDDEASPLLVTQAIEAYRKGGFPQLVLEGKREYVRNYNFGTAFWQGRKRADYPQIAAELKTHLTDLAAYHHAQAQQAGKPADKAANYAQAAQWYRLELQSFPDDADASQVNFHLADALYESGDYAHAVDEYERTAYTYAPGPDSANAANAAYAALSAYQKQEALLPEGERAAWHARSLDSGVRFARAFPAHPDSAGVLTRAAEELYQAHDLPRALDAAGLLLARNPPAAPAQRRIAWGVTGQAQFDQGQFAAAESAWSQARALAAGDKELTKTLNEQLSVAVYRQGEARRAAGDERGAVDEFLRVAAVAPGAAAVETAQYDAAAGLIKLQDWPRAIQVLEAYRHDYPRSTRQSDVTQKLAVAYMQAGRGTQAAAEYERIAAASDQPAELRLEALGLAADQYGKAGDATHAVALLEKLVAQYPAPVPDRIETRQKLADYAAQAGDSKRVAYWQQEIVKAEAQAGAARTDRTRFLAAQASLALAAPARDRFRALRLTAPLGKSLKPKKTALDTALAAYRAAAAYDIAAVATQANFEIAELYHRLAADLLDSERPKKMSADEREQYDLLLEEQATPFEEQAISLHEANAARVRDGLYDDGVKASYTALAQLLPARFGKTELPVAWSESLALGPDASASWQRAAQLQDAGNLAEAEAAWADAVRLAPLSAAPLNQLALAQRQRGEFAAAADSYARALALDPQYAPALRNLAVLRDLYQDDPAGALPLLEQYHALTGEDRPVTSWIADVKQRASKRGSPPAPAQPEAG